MLWKMAKNKTHDQRRQEKGKTSNIESRKIPFCLLLAESLCCWSTKIFPRCFWMFFSFFYLILYSTCVLFSHRNSLKFHFIPFFSLHSNSTIIRIRQQKQQHTARGRQKGSTSSDDKISHAWHNKQGPHHWHWWEWREKESVAPWKIVWCSSSDYMETVEILNYISCCYFSISRKILVFYSPTFHHIELDASGGMPSCRHGSRVSYWDSRCAFSKQQAQSIKEAACNIKCSLNTQ